MNFVYKEQKDWCRKKENIFVFYVLMLRRNKKNQRDQFDKLNSINTAFYKVFFFFNFVVPDQEVK